MINYLIKCRNTGKTLSKESGNITDHLPSKKQRLSLPFKHSGKHSFMEKSTLFQGVTFLESWMFPSLKGFRLKCGTSHRKWGHPWGRSGVGEHLVLLMEQDLFLGWDRSQSIKHTHLLHYQPTLHKLKHEEYFKIPYSKMSDFVTKAY